MMRYHLVVDLEESDLVELDLLDLVEPAVVHAIQVCRRHKILLLLPFQN